MRKRPAHLGMILFVAIAVGDLRASIASDSKTDTPKPPVVFLTEAKLSSLYDQLVYPARVVAKVNTTLLAESDGVVSRLHATLGQPVRRGQRILTISHTDPVYRYAPLAVLAPVAGVVSGIEVSEGSQVSRGQKLAAVTDPRQIRITVEVPAPDVASLTKGMTGELRLTGFAGQGEPIAVAVRGVSPFVDPATGTASCELDLVKARPGLAPGTLGQVSFKANQRQGYAVPDDALFYKGQETYLRLYEGGKARQVAVRLGRKQRGNVEVLSGLQAGARIIQRSSRFVADGDAVEVEKAEPAGKTEKTEAK